MERYNDGEVQEPELDEYFVHDRAVRESGEPVFFSHHAMLADVFAGHDSKQGLLNPGCGTDSWICGISIASEFSAPKTINISDTLSVQRTVLKRSAPILAPLTSTLCSSSTKSRLRSALFDVFLYT